MGRYLSLSVAVVLAACSTARPSPDVCQSWSPENNVILIEGPAPPYPWDAFMQHREGWVTVRATLSREGRLEGMAVVESIPKGVFERNTLRTLPQWRYCPVPESYRGPLVSLHVMIAFVLPMAPPEPTSQ